MPDEPPSPTLDTELTTNIVAAYVRRNQIGADQLPVLISTVHLALVGLGRPAIETAVERKPAVPIRRSVHRDYVVCLEFGWRCQMLRRHFDRRVVFAINGECRRPPIAADPLRSQLAQKSRAALEQVRLRGHFPVRYGSEPRLTPAPPRRSFRPPRLVYGH